MNRILKKDGLLLTSTDYWPEKIPNLINTDVNPKNSPDNIFSRREIEEDIISIADKRFPSYRTNRFHARGQSCSLE